MLPPAKTSASAYELTCVAWQSTKDPLGLLTCLVSRKKKKYEFIAHHGTSAPFTPPKYCSDGYHMHCNVNLMLSSIYIWTCCQILYFHLPTKLSKFQGINTPYLNPMVFPYLYFSVAAATPIPFDDHSPSQCRRTSPVSD